jgi:citrate synthase
VTWIDAAAAADRLGVKPATLYAYVSRGVLRRRRDPDSRRSLFDAAEIEELARRGRPRRAPELQIESRITALGPDRPFYRGRDALDLAGTRKFEDVAEYLWTGTLPAGDGVGWQAAADGVPAAVVAQSGLPAEVLPLDRLQVITAVLAATDPLRFHLDPATVAGTGRRMVAGMVDALPALADPGDQRSVAGRLWGKLTARPAEQGLLRVLDAALVLLADHELAASTLAARVAASARADPYAVVSTGLGALGGPMHGGASFAAERLLAELTEPARTPRVIGEWLRRGEHIPGLGHTVYKAGDGRAGLLLELMEQAAPGHDRLAAATAVITEARARRLPHPNIDLALAALAAVAEMVPGAGEAIFAVARTAGWLAHALEEYERGALLRPRAVYTGPPAQTG